MQNPISDRTHCIAQLRLGSSFLLSVLRFLDRYHRLLDKPEASYPPAFFFTSTRDDRVHPAHARKTVRRLHELWHGATTHYYENIEGGHGGAANNKQRAYMWALTYEFLRVTLGLPQKGSRL